VLGGNFVRPPDDVAARAKLEADHEEFAAVGGERVVAVLHAVRLPVVDAAERREFAELLERERIGQPARAVGREAALGVVVVAGDDEVRHPAVEPVHRLAAVLPLRLVVVVRQVAKMNDRGDAAFLLVAEDPLRLRVMLVRVVLGVVLRVGEDDDGERTVRRHRRRAAFEDGIEVRVDFRLRRRRRRRPRGLR
jgi:hypothetical protein